MSTALAQQLQRLAVPSAKLLHVDRQRGSLLFDPKEAAQLDSDTIYGIGINGLEELALVEAEFENYREVLFSESSKFFQRSVHSKEINRKLDEDIKELLNLLSPYSLTRPAQKVLEWLIYRYNIHMFNVDALIGCVLPFHATMLFVRVMQLINVDNLPNWSWLKPIQNLGKPLSKKTLCNFASRSMSFLKFICEMAKNLFEEEADETQQQKHDLLIAFYATSIVGSIYEIGFVSEETLTLLLPYITKGLKATHSGIVSASLMIINAVVVKSRLSESLLKVLVKRIGEIIITNNEEAIKCLLVIYQNQTMNALPESTFLSITNFSTTREMAVKAAKDHESTAFVRALLEMASEYMVKLKPKDKKVKSKEQIKLWIRKWKSSRRFVRGLLNEITLTKAVFSDILKHMLKVYLGNRQKCHGLEQMKLKRRAAKLIAIYEMKQASLFDEVLPDVLTSFSQVSQEHIQSMMILTTHLTQKSAKKSTVLMLCLNHPNELKRLAAIELLFKSINTYKDKTLLENDVCNRLLDNSYKVVKLLLSKPNILCAAVSPTKLLETLKKVRDRRWSKESKRIRIASSLIKCAGSKDVYTHVADEDRDKLWLLMLPFMFPTSIEEVRLLVILKSSFLVESTNLLRELFKNDIFETLESIKSNDKLAELISSIVAFVSNFLGKVDNRKDATKMFDDFKEMVQNNSSVKLQFFSLTLFSLLIDKVNDPVRQMEIISTVLQGSRCIVSKRKDVVSKTPIDFDGPKLTVDVDCLKIIDKNGFPLKTMILCLERIVCGVNLSSAMLEQKWWIEDQPKESLLSILVDFFAFILDEASHSFVSRRELFQKFLSVFIQHFFKDKSNLVKFCSLAWFPSQTGDKRIESLLLHARSLSLLSYVLGCVDDCEVDLSTVMPLLLISLNSEQKPIRSLTLKCIECLKKLTSKENIYFCLLKNICSHQVEIELDSRHLSSLLNMMVTENSTTETELMLDDIVETLVLVSTPDIVKANFLPVLDSVPPQILLPRLTPLLNEQFGKLNHDSGSHYNEKVVKCLISKFTPDVAIVMEQNPELYDAFKNILCSSVTFKHYKGSSQCMALEAIKKAFFAYLPSPMQEDIFKYLLDLKVQTTDSEIVPILNRSLKKSFIHATQFDNFANVILENDKSDRLATDSKEWKCTIILLEILVAKKKLKGISSIVGTLFKLLKTCLEVEKQDTYEYAKQMILTSLQGCLRKLSACGDANERTSVSERDLDVNAVVQCLRVSNDPETHRCALMLINLVATLYGEAVLHNIVNIFTFMGSSLLRQDNHYKIRLMEDTLKAVIPVIFQFADSNKISSSNADELVITIMRVFVDAFADIPSHRRMVLFVHLASMLKPEENLWIMTALLLEHFVTNSKKDKKNNTQAMSPEMSFAMELNAQFAPNLQVAVCVKLMTYLSKLPRDKVAENKSKVHLLTKRQKCQMKPSSETLARCDIFNITKHSANKLRYFKISIVSWISTFLGSKIFLRKLAEMEEKETKNLEPFYQQLLSVVLEFLSQMFYLCENTSQDSTAKFGRVLVNRTYEILDKLNSLLPNITFLDVMTNLMTNSNSVVRAKTLEMVATRLQSSSASFNEGELPHFIILLNPILRVLRNFEDDANTDSTTQQNALLCIKLISRILKHSFIDNLKQAMDDVIEYYLSCNDNHNTVASCILCIVELCDCLRAHSIVYLQRFVPSIVQLLEDHAKLENNDLLYLSIVTALGRLLEILPNFLSPYLESMLLNICILPPAEGSKKSMIATRLKLVYKNLATQIPPRVLLPCIEKSYVMLSEINRPLGHLLAVLNACIDVMHKDEATRHLSVLLRLFLLALDYHSHDDKVLDDSLANEAIEPILTLVMKLSEMTFRPFFHKILSWATEDNMMQKNRMIIFFHLADQLANKLKGLFVLFASHLINTAIQLLVANNMLKTDEHYFNNQENAEQKTYKLLTFLMGYLQKCFLYDNDDFVNRERFDVLMQPLVDQIENETCNRNYQRDFVAPCIAQFAAAVGDDAAWKQLNYAILLKTRETTFDVRLASMDVLEEMVKKLDKAYLSLVPETIPFLAELMEDDDERVESRCQKLISNIEMIVGESLQNYF